VDEIDDVDRSIGSINTVIKQDGKLVGKGTDGLGALKALVDAGVELKGRSILLLGAGGVARAIGFTLAKVAKVSQLTLLDIDEDTLRALDADLRSGVAAAVESSILNEGSLARAMAHADVIINCTPIGMHPRVDASLVPIELFRPGQAVFDVIYTPLKTKLLVDAEARGLKTISGVDMFINQAALQFEHFTGEKAPVETMRRVVLENLAS